MQRLSFLQCPPGSGRSWSQWFLTSGMSDAGLDPQRSVLLSQRTPFTLDVSAASFSTMLYNVEDNPGKALEIAFASQVSRNTEVLPFGKIKTIDIIQYQYCSEIAVIMIGKKKNQ